MLINMKYIAIEKTVNIILRNMQRSPERCARNLLELGSTIYKKNNDVMKEGLYPLFLDLCKKNKKNEVKELFYRSFLE